MVVGLWLRALGSQRTSFALVALLAAGGLAMIYLDNKGVMFGERTLVALVRTSDEPIYTDPATLKGASFLLEHTALADRVVAGAAPAGSLFFYNPSPRRGEDNRDDVKLEPRATWTLVHSITEKRKISARILQASGLEAVLPVGVVQKLDPPPHRCYLYRLPLP